MLNMSLQNIGSMIQSFAYKYRNLLSLVTIVSLVAVATLGAAGILGNGSISEGFKKYPGICLGIAGGTTILSSFFFGYLYIRREENN